MRKLYSFILATLCVAGVSAQSHAITGTQEKTAVKPFVFSIPGADLRVATPDTIWDYIDRATAFYILTAGSSGYVLGTSNVSSETGTHYDGIGNALVNELLAYFTHKEVMGGSAQDLTGKVYAVGADSMPTNLLGSGTVNVDDIDTSGFPTSIILNNSTYSTAGFFVAIEYGAIDDTVAILSNNPTTLSGGPDGGGEKRTRQFVTSIASWMRAWEVWTIGGAAYDADALIIPVLDNLGVGINPGVTTPEMTLFGAYPNPSNDFTTIRYSLDAVQNVSITIFDIKGRIVQQTGNMTKSSGQHEATFNLSNYAAGKYYYTIKTDNSSLTSKFVVAN